VLTTFVGDMIFLLILLSHFNAGHTRSKAGWCAVYRLHVAPVKVNWLGRGWSVRQQISVLRTWRTDVVVCCMRWSSVCSCYGASGRWIE